MRLTELFGAEARDIRSERRQFTFRYRSTAHWLAVFRSWYGPMHKAFAALPPEGQAALAADLGALVERFNVAKDGTMVVPGAYLESVITKV